jgi:hypothetical protein
MLSFSPREPRHETFTENLSNKEHHFILLLTRKMDTVLLLKKKILASIIYIMQFHKRHFVILAK